MHEVELLWFQYFYFLILERVSCHPDMVCFISGFFLDYFFFPPLVCAEILSMFFEGVVVTTPSLLVCLRFDALSGSLVCAVELMLGFDVSSWRGLLQSFEVLFLQACGVDFGWWC